MRRLPSVLGPADMTSFATPSVSDRYLRIAAEELARRAWEARTRIRVLVDPSRARRPASIVFLL
jgi:hypothetical protein